MMSAASMGLNIVQDMSEPVFEMKFESLPPASKVGYRQVLLTHCHFGVISWIQVHMLVLQLKCTFYYLRDGGRYICTIVFLIHCMSIEKDVLTLYFDSSFPKAFVVA